MIYRAERKDGNGEVKGCLFQYKYSEKIYIVLNEYSADELQRDKQLFSVGFAWYEIRPETLAMETTVKDKHGKMIFGSIPVNGKMSEGGDTVRGKTGVGCEGQTEVWYRLGAFYPLYEGEFFWSDIEIVPKEEKQE